MVSEKVCTSNIITSFWYGLVFIVNIKWKNKIYKLGSFNDRIPVLPLTRSRSKKQKESNIWIEKDGFKSRSRLVWKIVETFYIGHKLNCKSTGRYASHSVLTRQKQNDRISTKT